MMAISNEELMAKAREAKSAEELLALAKENDVELTEESAKAYFEQMNQSGELSDGELDSVAGGGCHKSDGRLVVTVGYDCWYYECDKCGRQRGCKCHTNAVSGVTIYCCNNCKYMTYEKGLWLCNHPKNRK